ncbi:DNA methyltransferase [[Pasteurella] aerogenes]
MHEEKCLEKNFVDVDFLPINTKIGSVYKINQRTPNEYTHGFFKYPCKFIPEIPRWAIKKYLKKTNGLVFDPFSGSGTTLLEANILGHNAYGCEIDLVAQKIILAKTQHYSLSDLYKIDEVYSSLLFNLDKSTDIFRPDINNFHHWFCDENALLLGKLRSFIDKIEDNKIKVFFEVVFLSIIKPTSQADDISPKPYVSRKVIKQAPDAFNYFQLTFDKYRKMLQSYSELNIQNTTKIVKGDALSVEDAFLADIAITSPPYINAFDYARTLRLENLWLGNHSEQSILESKSHYVGTERFNLKNEKQKESDIFTYSSTLYEHFSILKDIDEKRAYIVKKFFEDMKCNMVNVVNHLKKDAYYIIVIGNSSIRNRHIESWKILKDISQYVGFEYIENFAYFIQNPYIRIPRNGKGGLTKLDHILVLKKV